MTADTRWVFGRLARTLTAPDKPQLDPLSELVLTILSQSTTDANRDRAWDRIVDRFPGPAAGSVDWLDVLASSPEELESLVRVAGLGNQKQGTIRGVLEALVDEVGEPSLDHIESMSDDEAIEYMTRFKGVGVKTAACVLCFSLRRDVLPVDTHVIRIARRLAWVPPKTSATKAHDLLADQVEPGRRFEMHMLLITFGREICRAPTPSCDACPVAERCPRVGVT